MESQKLNSKLFFVFIALLFLFPLSLADPYDGCAMMGGMYGAYGFGPALFSWMFMVLIIVALILLIIWLIKQIQKK